MKKSIKNLISNIIGLIMILLGVGMILLESPITYIGLMFGIGIVLFISYTSLGDIAIGVLKKFTHSNEK